MAFRLALLLSTALVVLPGSMPNPVTAQQNARRAADIELPPISWACPMNGVVMPDGTTHADVYEDDEGELSDLQDGAGRRTPRLDLDVSGPFGDRRKAGRQVPDRSARSGAGDRRGVVDLCRAPGDRPDRAREMCRTDRRWW